MNRRGALLIIAVGLSAIVASLVLAFIVRARLDSEESRATTQSFQARIMLAAACGYILECSRVGWDLPGTLTADEQTLGRTTWVQHYQARTLDRPPMHDGQQMGVVGWPHDPNSEILRHPGLLAAISLDPTWPAFPHDLDNRIHEEAFGWVDVRDGSIGPRTLDYDGKPEFESDTTGFDVRFNIRWNGNRDGSDYLVEDSTGDGNPDRPAWPAVGGVARAPMEVFERPPHAISLEAAPNAIINDPAHDWFGYPLLHRPDPQPAVIVSEQTTAAAVRARWDDLRTGSRVARPESRNLAWFRVLRDGPATFVVTVGSGATYGYRDWDEVRAGGSVAEARFGGDRTIFEDLLAAEVRLWYRVEWSAAVLVTPSIGAVGHDIPKFGTVSKWATFSSERSAAGPRATAPWSHYRNHGGSIRYIQRLRFPPDRW